MITVHKTPVGDFERLSLLRGFMEEVELPATDAYVVGGSVVRCFLGLPVFEVDVRITPGSHTSWIKQLMQRGWSVTHSVQGSGAGAFNVEDDEDSETEARALRNVLVRTVKPPAVNTLDTFSYNYGPPEETIVLHDIRASMLAMDRTHLWHADGTLEDIKEKRLVVLRRTVQDRLTKYEQMGLTRTQSLAGVLLPAEHTYDQRMGLDPIPCEPLELLLAGVK
jgi:hypothetical protein